MRMFRHVVLINWKNGAARKQIEEWVALCNRIPDECPMVYNWFSSYSVPAPDPTKPSSHAFCLHFDLRSREEWNDYLKHPFPNTVYEEGTKIIDLERTASANMAVEAEPTRKKSQIVEQYKQAMK